MPEENKEVLELPNPDSLENKELEPTPPVVEKPQSTDKRDEIIATQNAVIGDLSRDMKQMREMYARMEQKLNAEPPVPPEKASEMFFANPQSMIGQEIAKQLKPLNDFRAQMERNQKYETLKLQMKRDPRFVALKHEAVESALDNLVSEHEAFDVSKVVRDYYTALGTVAATGQLTNETPTPPTPKEPVSTTPPHLRPSAPPPREVTPSKPGTRQLTENEKHLARLNGMTDEEYLREMGGESVTSSMTLDTFAKKEGK